MCPQRTLHSSFTNLVKKYGKKFGIQLEALPYWKSLRGWEKEETVKEFIKYVAKVVEELRDWVDYWVTISEPMASVIGSGYIAGLWPPG
jgi:beta-glucosidase/6-phospho-beta-glucosidase/beta-galactosidase